MVQIPTFENKNVSQRTSGVPFAIPNVSDAATLPFRQLSNQADKLTGIASQFQKAEADQEVALDKLNTQQQIKEYQLNEKYKTDVFKLTEELESDFRKSELTLNRKTKVKSTYNSILPLINEAKIKILENQDTTTSKEDWDKTTKKIYNNAIKDMDDDVVKQLFTAKFNDLLAIENIDVNSNIRKIDVGNAITQFNIDKQNLFNDYLNYPEGHPKRTAALKKLFGGTIEDPNIFVEAAGDLILDKLPDLAIIEAKKELFSLEATKMVDENPGQFLKLLEQGYWDSRLDPATLIKLEQPAIDNKRAMDVDYLVSFMPVDPNMSLENAEELYKEAKSGNFGGNEEYQNIYNGLDTQGKSDFNKAINQQRSHVRTEISFQQTQESKAELDANNDLYVDTFQKITLGELNISDIDNIEFKGKLGTQYKTLLKDLIAKREQNLLPTDQNLELHDKIFKKIMNGEIQSITDQVIMHDGENKSILELTGGEDGLGTNQTQDFYNLIANRNNTDVLLNARYFEEFVAANKDNILGNAAFAKLNLKAEPRFFQFKLIMKQRFEEGIKNGKNVFELLDKTSEHYILKDIQNYIPTKETQINEVKDSMTFNEEENTDNSMPQIGPNETWDEFTKSDRYLKWKASQ